MRNQTPPFTPESIKAVAVDLDGTLLTPEVTISDRTVCALQKVLDGGRRVILCTGRSPGAAEPFRKRIGAEGPMVYYNGATVFDMPQARLLDSRYLSAEIVLFCARLARSLDIHYHIFLKDERLLYEKRRSEALGYEERNRIQGETRDFETLFAPGGEDGCIKAMFIAPAPVLDRITREVEAAFSGKVYATRSHETYLEILHPEASKGHGLSFVLSRLGLRAADVVAFGDADNDIPLIRAAGWGVAMGNAVDSLKEVADAVCLSNADDGVARFLEEHVIPV